MGASAQGANHCAPSHGDGPFSWCRDFHAGVRNRCAPPIWVYYPRWAVGRSALKSARGGLASDAQHREGGQGWGHSRADEERPGRARWPENQADRHGAINVASSQASALSMVADEIPTGLPLVVWFCYHVPCLFFWNFRMRGAISIRLQTYRPHLRSGRRRTATARAADDANSGVRGVVRWNN